MSDFEDALQGRLARNEELAAERRQAEQAMDRAQEQARERERRRREQERSRRRERHDELTRHLRELLAKLEDTATQQVITRSGWTESGEEFLAKLETIGLDPRRSLLLELDRDDDEVLARWHSEVGDSLELYRLTDVSTRVLDELVLGLIDQELWQDRSGPPSFPNP